MTTPTLTQNEAHASFGMGVCTQRAQDGSSIQGLSERNVGLADWVSVGLGFDLRPFLPRRLRISRSTIYLRHFIRMRHTKGRYIGEARYVCVFLYIYISCVYIYIRVVHICIYTHVYTFTVCMCANSAY